MIISVLLGFIYAMWGVISDGYENPLGMARVGHVMTGFATFWIILCFWQRIRRIFCKPKMTFLDTLCIAQHDDAKKEQGIFGLATFLDHAETLTVLWSRKFFSRLWCTYEVSTFLRHQHDKPVQVMPVTLAWLFLLMVTQVQAISVVNVIMDECDCIAVKWALRGSLAVPGYAVMIYMGMGLIQDLKDLGQQLQDFSSEKAECFCCSCDHVHPETGKVLPCDRQMVSQTMCQWFGASENFDRLVRQRLTKKVSNSIKALLTAQYPMHVAVAATAPLLILQIPQFFQEEHISVDVGLKHFARWARLPLSALVGTFILTMTCRVGSTLVQHRGLLCRAGVSFLLAFLLTALVSLLWIPINLLDRNTGDKGGLLAIPVTALFWLRASCCMRLHLEEVAVRDSQKKELDLGDIRIERLDSCDTLGI